MDGAHRDQTAAVYLNKVLAQVLLQLLHSDARGKDRAVRQMYLGVVALHFDIAYRVGGNDQRGIALLAPRRKGNGFCRHKQAFFLRVL